MSQINQIKQYNFTQEQITKLFQMQDQLNTYIHPEWKTQEFNWGLAILDECMEIHGHLSWKWWKKDYKVGLTEANKKQVQLEVIDILHFVISKNMEESWSAGYTLSAINNFINTGDSLEQWLKYVTVQAADENIDISDWPQLAALVDLTEQEILETYTQKYVLNKFRQDHGYKDGSYCKEWEIITGIGEIIDGIGQGYITTLFEDNEYLSRIVVMIEHEGQDTTDEIELYNRLELAYNSRLNQ